ncbi:MAG: hypothetical protein K9L86_05140 [Candidatus Omnitrophica bacterium]|nr:hypothetical protein [Candidatus Omnitrophota bacterium]
MSKKDKIKLIITGFLVLILIMAIGNAKKTVQKVQERRKKTLESTVLTEQEDSNIPYNTLYPNTVAKQLTEGLYQKLEEETRLLALKRDPFTQNRIETKVIGSGLSLGGIIWNEKDPKAVIDDRIVGLGDQVGKKTIIEITPSTVLLSDGTSQFELRLGR